jgi:hypothetical protein
MVPEDESQLVIQRGWIHECQWAPQTGKRLFRCFVSSTLRLRRLQTPDTTQQIGSSKEITRNKEWKNLRIYGTGLAPRSEGQRRLKCRVQTLLAADPSDHWRYFSRIGSTRNLQGGKTYGERVACEEVSCIKPTAVQEPQES